MNRKMTLFALAFILTSAQSFAQTNVQEAASKAAQALVAAPDEEAQAKKPNYWTKSVKFDLGFTNTTLTNWAAGGNNQTALTSGLDAQDNFKKDLMYWDNRLQLDYGFLYSDDKPFIQKNKDRIYFESKWGFKPKKESEWSFTSSFNFRSQFTNTHKYVNPGGENPGRKEWLAKRTLQSGFISPAYTDLSVGIDWAPKPWFSINFSPVTGGFTIVHEESLRKNYSMPLKEEFEDITDIEPYMYKGAKFQFGSKFTANAKFSINDVVTGETQLVLFSDYLDNPQDLRVNWDNKITWQLAKHFSLAFQTWLIYDPNVMIDGVQKVQFKEFLTLNYTYTLTPRK